jgi:hypothetical protein
VGEDAHAPIAAGHVRTLVPFASANSYPLMSTYACALRTGPCTGCIPPFPPRLFSLAFNSLFAVAPWGSPEPEEAESESDRPIAPRTPATCLAPTSRLLSNPHPPSSPLPAKSLSNNGPRPWHSCARPPQVDELATQGRLSYGWPGDSQEAPRLEGEGS